MTKRFKFSIATFYNGSEYDEIVEIEFDDNATENEIYEIVNTKYTEWLFEQNRGGFFEIE